MEHCAESNKTYINKRINKVNDHRLKAGGFE